jgi:copper chaperone
MAVQRFEVAGMSCQHCIDAITKELSRLDGVTAVSVDLDTALVTVEATAPLDEASIKDAVDEAGYDWVRMDS